MSQPLGSLMDPSGRRRWFDASRTRRHAVQTFDDGAVLIDLDTGELLQLNASAAFLYGHLASGAEVDELARRLASRFAITAAQAEAGVSSFLDLEPTSRVGTPTDDPSPFTYVAANGGFAVEREGVPVFFLDPAGRWITTTNGPADRLRAALMWVAPKLLTLQGHMVLHASAVALGGRGMAFSGRSGAGKTTLARALAAGGASLLAEDSVVVRLDPATNTLCLRRLEARAVRFADSVLGQAGRTTIEAGRRIPCDQLLGREEEAQVDVQLDEILLLDRDRRQGDELRIVPLSRTTATAGLVQNVFWASSDEAAYRRTLSWAGMASGVVSMGALTTPAGLPQLRSASRRYAEKTAS